jgi:hypothetical protein
MVLVLMSGYDAAPALGELEAGYAFLPEPFDTVQPK